MSYAQIDFLRGWLTAQEEIVRLADAEARRDQEETQLWREEVWELRAAGNEAVYLDARRCKRNQHGGSSLESPAD